MELASGAAASAASVVAAALLAPKVRNRDPDHPPTVAAAAARPVMARRRARIARAPRPSTPRIRATAMHPVQPQTSDDGTGPPDRNARSWRFSSVGVSGEAAV